MPSDVPAAWAPWAEGEGDSTDVCIMVKRLISDSEPQQTLLAMPRHLAARLGPLPTQIVPRVRHAHRDKWLSLADKFLDVNPDRTQPGSLGVVFRGGVWA